MIDFKEIKKHLFNCLREWKRKKYNKEHKKAISFMIRKIKNIRSAFKNKEIKFFDTNNIKYNKEEDEVSIHYYHHVFINCNMSTETIDVMKCSNFLYEGYVYHGFNSVKKYEIETNPLNFMEQFNNKAEIEAYFWKGEYLK